MPSKSLGRFHKHVVRPVTPPDPDPPTGNFRTADAIVYAKGFGAPLRTDGKYPDWGKHELEAGFSANYDFKKGARPGAEGPPWPASFGGSSGWDHINAWFEFIPAVGGMPAAHRACRAQISKPKVHLYNPTTKVWTAAKTDANFTNMNGGYWAGEGTYKIVVDWPSTSPNAYWRPETIGWSIDLTPTVNADGTPRTSQCIAHGFWPSAFSTRLGPLTGMTNYSSFSWIRVITDSGSVDVNQSRYVGHQCGDVFLESSGGNVVTDPDGTTRIMNPALVQNRMLQLTSEWKPTGIVGGDESTIREAIKTHPLLNEPPPS